MMISDHLILFLDIANTVSGLLYISFSIRQKIWLWPAGILNGIIYGILLLYNSLYAMIILQLYYIIIGVQGWYSWNKQNSICIKFRTKSLSPTHKIIYLLFSLMVSFLIWIILYYFHNNENNKYDALISGLSVVGTFLLLKKYIDNWHYWILANSISCYLMYKQLMFYSAGLSSVFVILSIVGWIQWMKIIKNESAIYHS